MQTGQTKSHSPNTAPAKVAETPQKAAVNAASASRVPAWAGGMNDQIPNGLVLQDASAIPGIQAKLAISQPNDPYEQEADRVAEQVMRMPATRMSIAKAKPSLMYKESNDAPVTQDASPNVKQALSGAGQSLDAGTQTTMESHFGHDFSNVRIHTDTGASQVAHDLNAHAFTRDQDIYFADGMYQPNTTEGQRLLAHELTHTVQQKSGPRSALQSLQQPNSLISQPESTVEREANNNGNQLLGAQAPLSGTISTSVTSERHVIARKEATPTQTLSQTQKTPPMSIEQIQTRLHLLGQIISRLLERYHGEPETVRELQASLSWLNEFRTYLGARTAEDYSSRVLQGEKILDRAEQVLLQLDEQRETFAKRPEFAASRKGYVREVDKVRKLYFEAIAQLLAPEGNAISAFNKAEMAAAHLPRALIDVDFARLEHGGPPYSVEAQEELYEWIEWVRGKLDALEASAKVLANARQNKAPDLREREERFIQQRELAQLSMEGLEEWDKALQAFKYLAEHGNLIPGAFADAAAIVSRCRKMKAAAYANDLVQLRQRVIAHRNDPDVAKFYQALPLFVFGSNFMVGLAITLAASIITAGVAGLVTDVIGTSALATVGTVTVEALTFTLVSRGLQSLIPGQAPTGGFWQELAFNLVLFGTLRGLSIATKAGLSATGLQGLQGTVQTVLSFPILHGFGILQFRITRGRWPTSEELDMMLAQNLIMLAGLAIGMRAVQRWLPAETKSSALGKFRQKYGMRFESLEAVRQKLLSGLADLIDQGKATDKAALDDLKKRTEILENEFKNLIEEVQLDKTIDLEAVRAELKKASVVALEDSAELLSKGLGLQEDVGLQPTGGERQFTYRWGKTTDLEERLVSLGAQVEKDIDKETGLRTLTVRFKGGNPLTFQERPSYTGVREVNVNPADPVIQKLIAAFKIDDPEAQRILLRMLTIEYAKNPAHGLDSAAKPVRAKLRAMESKSDSEGSVQEQLLSLRKRGIEASKAPPKLVALLPKLLDAGILSNQAWLSARTPETMRGVVGEFLAYLDASSASGATSKVVLRSVRFIGILFKDAARTIPYRQGVDVVSELDLLTVSKVGANYEYFSLSNVKVADIGKSAKTARSEAEVQNQQALEALRAHAKNRVITVNTKEGQTLYGYIQSIKAIDPLGQTIDLTAHITEATTSGVSLETIGPKGSKGGFSKELQYTPKEISILVDLLREAQLMRTKDY